MLRRIFVQCFVIAMLGTQLQAEINIGANTEVVFATVEQAKEILMSEDDFVQRMSPFDRAARLQSASKVSERKYLEYVGTQVLSWNDVEKKKITSAFTSMQSRLGAMSLPFGDKVFIIKTTGKEEGGAAYTRANAIIFPVQQLTLSAAMIQKILCHELFHVLSRGNPVLREKLYSVIGFEKCDEVVFPRKLKRRKITNPDAPKNDHCIRLTIDDQQQWAIPILFSTTKKYDAKRGGPFFNYLQFKWLVVERDGESIKPVGGSKKPKLVDMLEAKGFFEQVGRNTNYTIHPEEILADNFAMLVTQTGNVKTPSILKNMEQILKDEKNSSPENTD